MLGLYFHVKHALSRCDLKEKWGEICRQKSIGAEAILLIWYRLIAA